MEAARRYWGKGIAFVVALGASVSIAQAEVVRQDANGFVVRTSAETMANAAGAWSVLVAPAKWWNPSHSFSGDAGNLTLTAVAGGCFCEALPLTGQANAQGLAGAVEHMRVVYVEPFRVLRLSGGLGPLQSEAVNGTWTITLKPTEKGTRILFEYVVGGYMRYTTDQIAPVVDKMIMEQLTRLAVRLGPVGPTSAQAGRAPVAEVPPVKAVPQTSRARPEVPPPLPVVPANGSGLAAAVDRVMMAPGASVGAAAGGQTSSGAAQDLPQERPEAPPSVRETDEGGGPVDPAPASEQHTVPPREYVQREFLVQLVDKGLFLAPVGEDGEPVAARFIAPGVAQKVRQAFGTKDGQMARARTLYCLCTGSYGEERGARVFNVLDAVLDWR